jgi:hypothetical protein
VVYGFTYCIGAVSGLLLLAYLLGQLFGTECVVVIFVDTANLISKVGILA